MRSGLAADAEKHGARIFEGTPAIGLDPAGVRKRVQTPHGVVRARHVVLAGSVGIAAVDAQLAGTVLPISTYVAVTAPLGEKLFEAVRYTGAVADTRRAVRLLSRRRRRPAVVGRAHLDAHVRRRGGSRRACAATS